MSRKMEIRKNLRTAVAMLPADQKDSASRSLRERLLMLRPSTLGIFLPLPDEPNLISSYQELLEQDHTLALSYPTTETEWTFHRIESLNIIEAGAYGLSYPEAGPLIPAMDLEVILVPGMGFTKNGKRIGRGKGIYDRLLKDTSARKIGICFTCQVLEDLPSEPWDIRMDEVWDA